METSNAGIIGVFESRETVNNLKNFYRQEYKKIKDEQKQTNDNYNKNKWTVRLGQVGVHVGLVFTPKVVKFFGRIANRTIGAVVRKVMQIKNKLYNRNVDRRLKKLEADFINLEGDFQQFIVPENTISEAIPLTEEVEYKVL